MAGPDLFSLALKAEGVSGPLADVARSIYQQESSGGRNSKTSNAGAVGGMQILPGTFAQVADKGWDIGNAEHNMRAGIRYLRQMDKLSGGVPELTAAGYYGGPGGLAKARQGIGVGDLRNPKAPDTLRYGREVMARMGKGTYDAAGVSPLAMPDSQVAGLTLDELTQVAPATLPQQPAYAAPLEEASLPQVQAVIQPPAAAPSLWGGWDQAMPKPMQMDYGFGQVATASSPEMSVQPVQPMIKRFAKKGAA